MKMKSILLMMLSLCLLVCLCACGDDTATEKNDNKTTTQGAESTAPATTTTVIDTNETEPSKDDSATTTTPVVTGPTQPVDGKANYTVIVTDEAGNPIPGATVQLCLESCMPSVTNAQGVASYPNMAVADYKVSFIDVPVGYVLPVNSDGERTNYYFEEDTYEMTLVLKAAN